MGAVGDPRRLSNVQNNVLYLCAQHRIAAGVTRAHVGRLLSENPNTGRHRVIRWESGSWGDDADDVIAAYAETFNLDTQTLWTEAARSWNAPLPESPKANAVAMRGLLDRAARTARRAPRGEPPKR